METKVYVDVLLVLNYVINMLLIMCTARLTGRRQVRKRMVAAALFGAVCALTIFLPFFGFVISLLSKLLLSMVMVLIAFSYIDFISFAKQLFVFFAVSFFFAGVMLAIWMAFTPHGMIYYNGIVYFNISSITLIITTVAAYGALSLFHRFSRGGRIKTDKYRTQIYYQGNMVAVHGLVDTGNSLYEPFSDTPVMICSLDSAAPLLPREAVAELRKGKFLDPDFARHGLRIRLIPYENVGGTGAIPAIQADLVILDGPSGRFQVERVYVGLSAQNIGDGDYSAILNPDLIGMKILQGGAHT